MKNVLIIQTGGTIMMRPEKTASEQVSIDPTHARGYLKREVPELNQIADIDVVELFYEDSSNLNPTHWIQIADIIEQRYAQYDGFVVLHGTDTMAYTGSALSFGLRNLGKPIIFTGSQVPLATLRSDARRNLINAVQIATMPIPEVGICFNDRLFRANRSTKMSIGDFDAFASPNLPPLAEIGLHINLSKNIRPAEGNFSNTASFNQRIFILKVFPGMKTEYIFPILDTDVEAIVIEGFGSGNVPITGTHSLIPFFESCRQKGVLLAMCSQAPFDAIDLQKYESGRLALEYGIIGSAEMTIEACVTKLMYLLAHHKRESVRELYQVNLSGEMS